MWKGLARLLGLDKYYKAQSSTKDEEHRARRREYWHARGKKLRRIRSYVIMVLSRTQELAEEGILEPVAANAIANTILSYTKREYYWKVRKLVEAVLNDKV